MCYFISAWHFSQKMFLKLNQWEFSQNSDRDVIQRSVMLHYMALIINNFEIIQRFLTTLLCESVMQADQMGALYLVWIPGFQ